MTTLAEKQFLKKVLSRIFKMVGRKYTPKATAKPNWPTESSWSRKQEAQYRAWLAKVIERDLMEAPAAADRWAGSFIFEYGWIAEEPGEPMTEPFSWFALVANGEILHETCAQNAVDARRKLLQLRRKPPVDADILPSDGHGNLKPYFAQRKRSTCFEQLDRIGKTGLGTDATKMISDDRE